MRFALFVVALLVLPVLAFAQSADSLGGFGKFSIHRASLFLDAPAAVYENVETGEQTVGFMPGVGLSYGGTSRMSAYIADAHDFKAHGNVASAGLALSVIGYNEADRLQLGAQIEGAHYTDRQYAGFLYPDSWRVGIQGSAVAIKHNGKDFLYAIGSLKYDPRNRFRWWRAGLKANVPL